MVAPTLRFLSLALAFLIALSGLSGAARAENRIALVIGNSEYMAGPAATAANDAGLVAQSLQSAGFEVIGARDLDWPSLIRSVKDFVGRANEAGPDTVAVVYLAGYGMQFEGDNYFLAIDARQSGPIPVPVQAVRLSTMMEMLRGARLKASVVILDAAREGPFVPVSRGGQEEFAGGLALMDPESDMLVAFNAAYRARGPVADIDPDEVRKALLVGTFGAFLVGISGPRRAT